MAATPGIETVVGFYDRHPINEEQILTKLAERGNAFELRGKRVVELSLEDGAIAARLARKLALTPEWDRLRAANVNEQRKLLDEVADRFAAAPELKTP